MVVKLWGKMRWLWDGVRRKTSLVLQGTATGKEWAGGRDINRSEKEGALKEKSIKPGNIVAWKGRECVREKSAVSNVRCGWEVQQDRSEMSTENVVLRGPSRTFLWLLHFSVCVCVYTHSICRAGTWSRLCKGRLETTYGRLTESLHLLWVAFEGDY